MPEVIIKYKNSRALQALKDFAKYFDFKISEPRNQHRYHVNGVSIIPGDSSVSTSALQKIFSGANLNAKELRARAWQRRK